ncbi:hypothetical protein [Kovacikia minuta]|nr:hypothetical protein [Kovacikia minuta]
MSGVRYQRAVTTPHPTPHTPHPTPHTPDCSLFTLFILVSMA